MKSVLVTGASGFIGQKLVAALNDAGYKVVSLKGDVTEQQTFKRIGSPEVGFVFHLAGRTFVPDSWRDPAEFEQVNVAGTMNVLEFCRSRQIPMTYVSAYLYGIPKKLPISESDEITPNNPYALSKFMAESVCKFYAEYYSVPVTIIRPFNIYGEGQKSHFLIPEIIAQVKARAPIKLKDLNPRRDYLYVDDLVEALLLTMNPPNGCNSYNIGYGSSLSVAEIVTTIQSVVGTALPVINENIVRDNEILDVYADISKAAEYLGWHPKTTFEQGIEAIINN
ncbi:MAG TPA: NAD(P)-dependent oxidoreductase [Methylotenera sp.]|nr:NAD(P)-dependent oxidoreductase [Methylotenera sp.]